LLRIALAWMSVDVLIQKTIPDDAFYYFTIARNLVENASVSLDGATPTNGFHPLWLMMNVPIFLLTRGHYELPIHLALTISAILDVTTGVVIYRLVMRLTADEAAAAVGIFAYLFNPLVIFQAVNGLETSLAVLLFALFTAHYIAMRLTRASLKSYALQGILGGLMLLARTDNAFLLAIIFFHALAVERGKLRFIGPVMMGALGFAMIAPWILWSMITVGTPLQTSGVAVPYVFHQLFVDQNGWSFAAMVAESFQRILNVPVLLGGGEWTGLPIVVGPILWNLLGVASFLIVSKSNRATAPRWIHRLRLLALPTASCALLMLFHTVLRWYPRPWYFVPCSLLFAMITGTVYSQLHKLSRLRRYKGLVGPILAEIFLIFGVAGWGQGAYPWQTEMYQGATWLAVNTPSSSRVASFNAGIYAYFSQRSVTNLDGTVNGVAFKAIQSRNLMQYILDDEIDFLIDYEASFDMYASFFGDPLHNHTQFVTKIDNPKVAWMDSSIQVYRVVRLPEGQAPFGGSNSAQRQSPITPAPLAGFKEAKIAGMIFGKHEERVGTLSLEEYYRTYGQTYDQ